MGWVYVGFHDSDLRYPQQALSVERACLLFSLKPGSGRFIHGRWSQVDTPLSGLVLPQHEVETRK